MGRTMVHTLIQFSLISYSLRSKCTRANEGACFRVLASRKLEWQQKIKKKKIDELGGITSDSVECFCSRPNFLATRLLSFALANETFARQVVFLHVLSVLLILYNDWSSGQRGREEGTPVNSSSVEFKPWSSADRNDYTDHQTWSVPLFRMHFYCTSEFRFPLLTFWRGVLWTKLMCLLYIYSRSC